MNAPYRSAAQVPCVHRLKVRLEGTKPPVWRRLVVPSDITLGSLHDVIQSVFGWRDAHLHVFVDRSGVQYAPPVDIGVPAFDEEETALADVLPRVGDRLDYTYDFGDDWLHRITVEEVRPAGPGERDVPLCTGGRRAMPPAEDLGGSWGLAELLDRYEAEERPRATVVRRAGGERREYDGPYDEVLARLHEEGFDPAEFDPAEAGRALAGIRLRRTAGTGRAKHDGPSGRPVPSGTYHCECGEPHRLSGDTPDGPGVGEPRSGFFEAEGFLLPAVRLPGEAELARAVRGVPVFMAAVRLGRWCTAGHGAGSEGRKMPAGQPRRVKGGRELTPKGLLRPVLARQAIEEAELWRIAPEDWGDPDERSARLAKVRSALDMELLNLPWEWALNCGFVEVEGNRAFAGDALPDEDDDASLLAAWREAAAGAVADLSLGIPVADGPLEALGEVLDEIPPLVFFMLLDAYGLPDGEWLDVAGRLADGLEGLPQGPARQLVSALLAEQFDVTAGTLELFGAAECEVGEDTYGEDAYGQGTYDQDAYESGEGLDSGGESPVGGGVVLSGDPGALLRGERFRLTPLGRSGLRTLLVQVGIPAPVIGSLARADAGELLAALASFPSEADAVTEVAGWLAGRSATDAAVQLVDACDGTEPADALRRLQAPRVLAAVLAADDSGRAKAVLRKAAVSQVTGCSHAAASMLRRIGEPAGSEAAWGLEWMLVDGMLPFARRGEQAVRERLLAGSGEGQRPLDQIAERADDLWRARHPHAREVLGTLAGAVEPVDKPLAKRLRKATFKAGSAT
ncbi:plasmid pRiA4b ORF-3 family protein [Streptomyces sp. NPDC059786]|uniref:plasmid pRiA4b ORF-3 family protein n=1 Tax=Streptomyces sp. NPDC059786 TaxID=3346946 RepID=UPI0036533A7A